MPPRENSRHSSRRQHRRWSERMRTGSALQSWGKEQWWCHLSALMHLPPVPVRPGWTRGSAKSPQLKFQSWHPGSHPAAQRRLEGFTRFPHKAGSFARKSKFINSVFQHEQTKASELDSQISQGLSSSPSTASSPTGKDSPFPPSTSWQGPSSLSGKPASGGVCVRCPAWEHPCHSCPGSQSKVAELASKRPQAAGVATQGQGQTQSIAACCPDRAKGHKFQCIA